MISNNLLTFQDFFISKKIIELFDDRNLSLFFKQHKYSALEEYFLKTQLIKLQKRIYKLDKYGERHWKLNQNQITKLWKAVIMKIENIGFSKNETNTISKNLYKYMLIEIQIRLNELPNRISISEYYELKICDVQLQREIIKSKANQTLIHNDSYYRLWQLIDIVSEIIDDLIDLKEDSKDFNCNRLLISNYFRETEIIKNDYANYSKILNEEFEILLKSQPYEISNPLNEIFLSKINIITTNLNNLDLSFFKSKIIEKLTKVSSKNYIKGFMNFVNLIEERTGNKVYIQ
jgi:hypothetical protein